MSLKKIDEVKRDRGFKIRDLIIYAVIALAVAAVFLSVFLTRDRAGLSGISVSVNDATVFEYDFSTRSYDIADETRVVGLDYDGDVLYVKIACDNGYNIISIDVNRREAGVSDADCRGKDCLYQKITDKSGIIYCSPHRLRVIPYEFEGDDGNIEV